MRIYYFVFLLALAIPIASQINTSCNCPPPNSCFTAGGCDPTSGACLYHMAADGSACTDQECCCILHGVCNHGTCRSNATCPPPNQCQQLDLCAPGGGCGYRNVTDGTPCTSTDNCGISQCVGGECLVVDYKACTPPSQCYTACCDPTTGNCVFQQLQNGSPCDDGDSCTVGDFCYNGTCKPGTPKECPLTTACYTPGKCDPTSGECLYFLAPDGTPCVEPSCCIINGQCHGGFCFPNTHCPPINNTCLQPTICPGTCGTQPVPNGTPCDDNNLCTTNDVCVSGSCSPGNPKVCPPPDQCHFSGVCDPATGSCTYIEVPYGTPCDDGNPCTSNDTCVAGSCVGGAPVVCSPPSQCFLPGVCSANGTCVYQFAPNGTACQTPNNCASGTCQGGVCVPPQVTCPAPPVCQIPDYCHSTTGHCVYTSAPEGTPCSNPCFLNATCVGGQCTGIPIPCPPAPVCYLPGFCNPSSGICSFVSEPDNTPCDDGNWCTVNDVCRNGVCSGVPKECPPPADACFTFSGCVNSTGQCTYAPSANGTPCVKETCCCVSQGTCQNGACVPTNTQCPPAPPCKQLYTCGGACEYIDLTDGTSCDDGNACTSNSTCISGQCVPGSIVQCAAPAPCQQPGVCNNHTGVCEYSPVPDNTTCQAPDLCTTSVCVGGRCSPLSTKICPPPPVCSLPGTCNKTTGNCDYVSAPNQSPCGNGCVCMFGMCKINCACQCQTPEQCSQIPDCGGGGGGPPPTQNQTICVDELASYQMQAPLNAYKLSDFNLMSFGVFQATSGDVEGRLATKGDCTITGGFSIGASITSSDPSRPYSLVVGGSLAWSQGSLSPASEGMYIGANVLAATPSYLATRRTGGPCPVPGCLDPSFNDAYQHLHTLSDTWSKTTPNTDSTLLYNTIMSVTTTDPNAARYYIQVPASEIALTTTWNLHNLNLDAEFIISVTGTGNILFQGGSFPGKPEKTVWNIPGQRTITIGGYQLVGALCAPDATLQQSNGVTQGFMYIGNVQSFLQINYVRCPPATP